MIKKITVLTLSLIISGCGLSVTQREAATRFASASTSVGDFSTKEFAAMRDVTIQMNTKDIALGGKAKINDLDGAFDVDDVAIRINAAIALSAYGDLLLALVDDRQSRDLRNATMQFEDSLRGVSGRTLSDADLDNLGALVYNIGGFFLEQQRAKALKQIVLRSKTDVDHLCDLLIQDFNPTGLNLLHAVDNTSKRLKVDADMALAAQKDNPKSKLFAIQAYRLADSQRTRVKKTGAQAVAVLTALKSANAELVNALENNSEFLVDTRLLGVKMKNLGLALKVFSGS
jgi:hypothetical protein